MTVFCCHGTQTKRQIGRLLAIFNCPFNICTKSESFCFSGFGGEVIKKKSFFKENSTEPFFHFKSMGAFCCHGNQTKRQITISDGRHNKTFLIYRRSILPMTEAVRILIRWLFCHFMVHGLTGKDQSQIFTLAMLIKLRCQAHF